jgi:K+-transporting ATPase A subunit
VFGFIRSAILLAYLIVGVLVAQTHHYLRHLHAVKPIASAVLAVVLWPIVLLGASLHLH